MVIMAAAVIAVVVYPFSYPNYKQQHDDDDDDISISFPAHL